MTIPDQSEIQASLYPNWEPMQFPPWMNNLKSSELVYFTSRYRMLGKSVEQAHADGLEHLVPIFLVENATPQDARKKIGKGNWKKLHKSTLRTNVWRARVRHKHPRLTWDEIMSAQPQNYKAMFIRDVLSEEVMYAVRKSTTSVAGIVQVIQDTRGMGVEVNLNWSIPRLLKEHDKAALAIKVKGSDLTPWFPASHCFVDGYEFTELTSEYDLRAEGVAQRHCVGSYTHQVKDGVLAVFAIRGKERATVSYNFVFECGKIQQIQGFANGKVSKKCRNAAVKLGHYIAQNGLLRHQTGHRHWFGGERVKLGVA